MFDQSYSVDNLSMILAIENRRGNYKEQEFFEEISRLDRSISNRRGRYKDAKARAQTLRARYRRAPTPALQGQISRVNNQIHILGKNIGRRKEIRQRRLRVELEQLSEALSSRPVRPVLESMTLPGGKIAYRIDSSAHTYFQEKQVQRNLKVCFRIGANSRDAIIEQTTNALSDKFPKVVLRTDIENFYESLSHETIKKIVDKHVGLDPASRRYTLTLLDEYRRVSGEAVGVPRGVGLSAVLAEIYMQAFDQKIKERDDVLYYSRYVDDILVIFAGSGRSGGSYIEEVKAIASEMSMNLNRTKTKVYDHPSNFDLQFLGYEIKAKENGKTPVIGVSKNRLRRYRKRISLAISDYKYTAMFDEKRSRRLLIDRLNFLTSNTHLYNNKRDAMVGVYFANRHVNRLSDFDSLDRFLCIQAGSLRDPALIRKVKSFSFKAGFETKRYRKFSTLKIGRIVSVWKYVS